MKSYQALTSIILSIEEQCHLRHGHLNLKDVVLLQRKDIVKGPSTFNNDHVQCDGCTLGHYYNT